MNKKIASLLALFIAQVIYSSCCKQDSNGGVYERSFKSVSVQAWNTLGFQNKIVEGTVPKFAFGLGIDFQFEDRQISFNNPKSNVGSFGFNNAMALGCARDRIFKYNDLVDSIEIVVIDVFNDTRTNISKDFYTSKNTTINEQIISESMTILQNIGNNQRYYVTTNYLVDLVGGDNVPDSAIFEVTVYLRSGMTLTNRTKQIDFS